MSFIRLTTTVFAAGLAAGFVGAAATGVQPTQPEDDADSVTLTGVVRDFHERTAPNGHPDFERRPSSGPSPEQDRPGSARGRGSFGSSRNLADENATSSSPLYSTLTSK